MQELECILLLTRENVPPASGLENVLKLRFRPHLKTLIFISLVGLQSTLSLQKRENALQTEGRRKRWLFVFVRTENILKRELFENDDVTMITWFPRPSFPQPQIQNGR